MATTLEGPFIGEGLIAAGVLIEGGEPIPNLWFSFSDDLTVLYGRNGSGKTLVLESASAALRGKRGAFTSTLVLDLCSEFGGFDPELFIRVLNGLRRSQHELIDCGEALREPQKQWDDYEARWAEHRDELRNRLRHSAVAQGHSAEDWPRLFVALKATGDGPDPRWELMLCGLQASAGTVGPAGNPAPTLLGAVRDPTTGAIMTIGLIAGLPPIACLDADEHMDVDRSTLNLLFTNAPRGSEGEGRPFERWDGHSVDLAMETADLLAEVATSATRYFSLLTGSRCQLEPTIRDPNDWIDSPPVRWEGEDAFGVRLPIDRLGSGWARWAKLAVSLAIRRLKIHSDLPAVLLVDEPERALHPAAQQQVANSFVEALALIEVNDGFLHGAIVATHSPAFLGLPGVRLVHVSRDDKARIRLSSIDPTAGSIALTAGLGLTRADVLSLTRWFIYVEGEHDKAVLDTVFSSVFSGRHARVVPMRGASNTAAHLEFDFIFEFTDARVRIVLDRIGAAASRTWSEAREAFSLGDPMQARRRLEALGRRREREAQWLCEAGIRALELGRLDRIDVVCLEEPDIICYLPVDSVVEGAVSWRQLSKEWHGDVDGRADFKAWLKARRGAVITSTRLAALARRIEDPRDLARVVEGL